MASALAYAVVKRPWITLAAPRPRLVGRHAEHGRLDRLRRSAVAAYVLEDGSLRNAQLANSGTWVGGVCFLLGAIFLIPEEHDHAEQSAVPA